MKTNKHLIVLIFALVFFSTHTFSQELNEDGSMKLFEVSTDKTYGYEADSKTAIKVGTIGNDYTYVKALLGPKGEKTQAKRLGSCCGFKCATAVFGSGLLDKWEISYQGAGSPAIIYLNGYEYETPKCPYGLTFKTEGEVVKVQRFPADSIVKVSACNDGKLYAVEDYLLNDKLGTELRKPDKTPEFIGGVEELKKTFIADSLTDEKVKGRVFKVSISFLVTCDGKAGNFQIISKGKGDLETYANQVLAVVNKMPQTWTPATNNGKAVDCYQVLSFTVAGGQLNRVSFK